MKDPVRVAVTGAAGQIGYSLLFRIASGEMLGKDQPVILSLLEITPALPASVVSRWSSTTARSRCSPASSRPTTPTPRSTGVNYALLVGSRPRTKGMERGELLEVNGAIFTTQGKALAAGAADDVRILVVGNPANTNCLIAMNNARSIPRERFTAMMRLDHNRAKAQLAAKCDVPVTAVTNMTVWGNHSATQYPDLVHAQVNGKPATELVDQAWIVDTYIPTVQQRGAKIIEARGASSAASAANAAVDHVRDWAQGTAAGDWVSMGICSDGSYGIPEGMIVGLPRDDERRELVGRSRPRPRRLLARASTHRWPSWPKSATRSERSGCSVRHAVPAAMLSARIPSGP